MKKSAERALRAQDSQILTAFVNLVLKKATFTFSGEEAIEFSGLCVQIKDIVDKLNNNTKGA